MFDVNVMSEVRLTRHIARMLAEEDWGRVVFVSSDGIYIPKEMVHYGFSRARSWSSRVGPPR